ncbi:MAG: trigger factor [bacterium]|nr:trigger factor [bacterium]
MADEAKDQIEETTEQQVDAVTEETEANLMDENSVSVEEAGKLRKKVTVTIPQATIDVKRNEMYGELGDTAQVPGFRIGHAPRRLIEKRFGKEVAADVRNALIGESLGHAIEKTDLNVLGEPDLELDDIELPESGEMAFSFEVEIAPEFDLPNLKDIPVNKRLVEVGDDRIDEYVNELRSTRATFEPSDGPAADGDSLVVSAEVAVEGATTVKRDDIALRVAPGQIEGLPLVDLGTALVGKTAGDTATLEVTVPEAHPNEDWKGKLASVEVTVKSLTSKILPPADAEFAKQLGFEAIDELREFVRERMSERIESEIASDMRAQVSTHLLDNTEFDLPEGVAARHTEGVLRRRYIELLRSGMPREQLDENMTVIQAEAQQQADRELRLQFILGKIADDMEIEISDGDLNATIASMAAQYQRRPEKMRQELESDGSLEQVRTSMREDAALDKILGDAKVTEVTEEPKEKKTAKKAAKKTAKKSAKKTAKKTEKKAAKKTTKKAAAKKTTKKAAKKTTKKAAGKSKDDSK